jgi:hypothetical protein
MMHPATIGLLTLSEDWWGCFRRRNDGARSNKDGELVDDRIAAMAAGAVDVVGGEGEETVANRADEEIERGLGELHWNEFKV